jgi:branched-chain amino acid transport system permease protein
VPMVVATIGLSFVLKGAVRAIPATQEVMRLPPLFHGPSIFIGNLVLQRQDIAIVVVAVLVMVALSLGFNLTATGKALRATSQNPRAAALIGIPVKRMRMMAWALASGLAGISGILLSPKLLMTPDMGSVVMLGIAASIIGGFTSLVGCVVGGILLGVVQNLVGIFISPEAIAVTPFFIIMLVLLVCPNGLFGEAMRLKKV